MHLALENIQSHTELRSQVCVIGAGAAGITIARHLAKNSVQTILIESGDFEPDEKTQSLYSGFADGALINSSYLEATRLRFFGGTTNHWGGYCRPLDQDDFNRRTWIEHSGWPIGLKDLESFYEKACEICEVPSFKYEFDNERSLNPKDDLLLDTSRPIHTKLFHSSPPTRFGKKYRQEILDASNIKLISNANVLRISLSPHLDSVQNIQVKTLSGKSFRIAADKFVLATGAIENARLLLISNIGNQADLVGRYFSDHVGFNNVALATFPKQFGYIHRNATSAGQMGIGKDLLHIMTLGSQIAEKNQLLRGGFYLREYDAPTPPLATGLNEGMEVLGTSTGNAIIDNKSCIYRVHLWNHELAPDPESRITLSNQVDELGLPKVKLHWQPQLTNAERVRRSVEVFAKILGQFSLGRVKILYQPRDPWHEAEFGAHHMGTTRMAENARSGVVDSQCKVFGLSNLFIGGSSVFPTYGCANPTLTIVTLAARIADTLVKELGKRS